MTKRSPGLLALITIVLVGLLVAFFGWLLGQGCSTGMVLCMAPLDVAAYIVVAVMLWLIFTDHGQETAGHG